MNQLLYGAAYYDEYMPYDRLDKDIEMMKAAGMNVVRIAESTWATCEPQPGIFDFSHVTRVIDAMEKAGMYVIVGTPTYAIPSWMEIMHPEVMAVQKSGRHIYGTRQCMDITSPVYRFYAERVIRKLMEVTAGKRCVIGFQLDNETKYYDTSGDGVQRMFVKYLREKFSLERMNHAFGLDYWSNRINSWEDFPDVRGTINGSLAAEFDRFRRQLVTEFLSWQASIVREYARPDQFITHNFDYEWRDWSFGVQPSVDHFAAAAALAETPAGSGQADISEAQAYAIAGCDIYHPSQNQLTGREIAFGGDLNRSLLKKNYLILETEAQGYPWWTPYPGQLRLQAYSHLASGADMVEYWHWHSIHNSFETYWKGVLSHDFEENDVYREAKTIGNEWKRIGDHLIHLKKDNKVAILVSNEALSALEYFKIDAISGDSGRTGYNDVVRWLYDALYDMNIECDFVSPKTRDLSSYRLLVVPALYSAPQSTLERINEFAENGGTVIETFKSAFTDEHVKVWTDTQPHELRKGAGVIYHEFAFPDGVGLKGKLKDEDGTREEASLFMEFLEPQGAEVLLSYDHPAWGKYAALTRNRYGKGTVYYLGCMTSGRILKKILRQAAECAGITEDKVLWTAGAGNTEASAALCAGELSLAIWPLIVRRGSNQYEREITYVLNYSGHVQNAVWNGSEADLLLPGGQDGTDRQAASVRKGDRLPIAPWGLLILEEK